MLRRVFIGVPFQREDTWVGSVFNGKMEKTTSKQHGRKTGL